METQGIQRTFAPAVALHSVRPERRDRCSRGTSYTDVSSSTHDGQSSSRARVDKHNAVRANSTPPLVVKRNEMPVHAKRMSWKRTAKSCEASRPRTVQKSQSHRKRRGLDAHAEWAVTERGEGDACAPLWLCFTPPVYKLTGGGRRGNDSFTLFEVDHSQTKAGGEGARGAHPPMSRRAVCVRASAPEFSSRFRLCAPCCAVSTRSSTRRKRACGVVPRLGPEGFSLARICRGTGCTPRKHRHPRKLLVRTYEDKRDTKNISGF